MATVYASPIPAPEWEQYEAYGKFKITLYDSVNADYVARCKQWLLDHGYHHKLTGEVICFPIADGYAEYMIMNGTKIMHLPLGDAWNIPEAHARGLRATDLADMVDSARKMAALFAKSKA